MSVTNLHCNADCELTEKSRGVYSGVETGSISPLRGDLGELWPFSRENVLNFQVKKCRVLCNFIEKNWPFSRENF